VVGVDVLEGSVMCEGRFAAEAVPGVRAALEPLALDVRWLLGFDGSWHEAGFALGDCAQMNAEASWRLRSSRVG